MKVFWRALLGFSNPQMDTDYSDFFGGMAGRKSQVAGRESTSRCDHPVVATVRVQALLGFGAEAQRYGTGILPVFHGRDAHATEFFWSNALPDKLMH